MENKDFCSNLQNIINSKDERLSLLIDEYSNTVFQKDILRVIKGAILNSNSKVPISSRKFDNFISSFDNNEYYQTNNDNFEEEYVFLLDNQKLLQMVISKVYDCHKYNIESDSILNANIIDISNGCYLACVNESKYSNDLNKSDKNYYVSKLCDNRFNTILGSHYISSYLSDIPEPIEINRVIKPISLNYLINKVTLVKDNVNYKKKTK